MPRSFLAHYPLPLTLEHLAELDGYVLGFGQDAQGELYVLTTQQIGPTGTSGQVLRIVPAE